MARKEINLSRYLRYAIPAIALSCLAILLATKLLAGRDVHTHIRTYRLTPDENVPAAEAQAQAVAILQRRMDALSRPLALKERQATPAPEGAIQLRFRTATDTEEVLFWLTLPGKAEFRLLHPDETIMETADPQDLPEGYEVAQYTQYLYSLSKPGELKPQEHRYLVCKEPAMVVRGFAAVQFDTVGIHKETVITFRFRPQDAELFREQTALNAGRQMAMLVDGRLFFPPRQIESAISGGTVQIRGYYYNPPLRKLVDVLNAGSPPGRLDELSHDTQ